MTEITFRFVIELSEETKQFIELLVDDYFAPQGESNEDDDD